MNTLKSILAVAVLAAASFGAQAEDLTASANIGTTCVFSNNVAGALDINGTSVTTDSVPTVEVSVNSGMSFNLDFTTGSLAAPSGMSLSSGAAMMYMTNTVGSKDFQSFTPYLLTAAGTYEAEMQLNNGVLNKSAVAGDYSYTVVLTCIAI